MNTSLLIPSKADQMAINFVDIEVLNICHQYLDLIYWNQPDTDTTFKLMENGYENWLFYVTETQGSKI